MTDAWDYTAAEKRAINAAFTEIAYWADLHHHKGETLAAAFREERASRSCSTAAKGMIVSAFLDGYARDPRASEIARYAPALQVCCVLGADAKRCRRGETGDFVAIWRSAVEAHEARCRRGLHEAVKAMKPQPQ